MAKIIAVFAVPVFILAVGLALLALVFVTEGIQWIESLLAGMAILIGWDAMVERARWYKAQAGRDGG